MNLVKECWGMLTAGILPEWLSGIIVHRKVLNTINPITGTGCIKTKQKNKKSVTSDFVPIRITEDINDGQLQAILVKGFNGLVASFPAQDASIPLIPQLLIG